MSDKPLTLRYGLFSVLPLIAAGLLLPGLLLFAALTTLDGPPMDAAFFAFATFSSVVILASEIFIVRLAVARLTTSIRLDTKGVRLILPGYRGGARRSPVNIVLRWDQIAKVASYTEAYRTLGIPLFIRAYALTLTDGTSLKLGAEPPLSYYFATAATKIASRAGLTPVDRGMTG